MHVQLGVAVAAGVLEERRHDPVVGVDVPAGRVPGQGPAVLVLRDRAVVAGPAVAGLVLQVADRRRAPGADRFLDDLGLPAEPGRRAGVPGPLRAGRRRLQAGVQHAGALVDGEREVEEHHRAAGFLARLHLQLAGPLRIRVRLPVQQLGQPLVRAPVPARRGPEPRLVLIRNARAGELRIARIQQPAVDRLHHRRLDLGPGRQPERRARPPGPHARRLADLGHRGQVVALSALGALAQQVPRVVAGADRPVGAQAARPPSRRSRWRRPRRPGARGARDWSARMILLAQRARSSFTVTL